MIVSVTFSGPILRQQEIDVANRTSNSAFPPEIIMQATTDLIRAIAGSIKEAIDAEINNSIKLLSFVGQSTDPETLRTILRSINVKVSGESPPASINVEYGDYLGHWYGGENVTAEFEKAMNEVVDTALTKWFSGQEYNEKVRRALEGPQ